jgi:hypothetical protein
LPGNVVGADQAQKPKSFLQQQQEPRPPMALDFDKLTPDEQRRVLDGLDLNG